LKAGPAAGVENTTPVFFAIHIDSITGRQSPAGEK
jgi:hypothetical protein